ncbi:class I SAM-dependent methyltransferase [Paenibacillus chibensis]|uniref:class I SAM-dependent methyltransferase n=1 Tax=Paenibacillus chibensis TaxID=59846 RepID=UPI000FD7A89D|nr:class I SAM-dependent methyltransferase [Paenibacillus chibensis]MEC0368468.1 class I SAM-dependent methyltransferase [Paenibacillus chibensis]
MHRFWEKVIKPIIIAAQPQSIVEIGSLTGLNTFKLLDYCQQTGARCTVIDPASQFDTELLQDYYGENFQMLRELSLEAMPKLDAYDMILVDGDHNWYTVYHELKQVERMARETGVFPIVLLHDVDWPYGRRDMYYYPESIPQEYRKPNAKQGMLPGNAGLLPLGGFNGSVSNAVLEHGDRNGVLTAVEDFLRETAFDLTWHELHACNGLGILMPADAPALRMLPYILSTSGM